MKICFLGTVEFSAKIFQHLLSKNIELVGLVTSDKNSINADYVDLIPFAKNNNIPVLKTTNVNSHETIKWISDLNADVIFCFGWSRLLKSEILNLTRLGVIGFHPAELPMNRGRHPLIWALALGLSHTASTFFFMDEGADSGDILSQEIVPIYYKDTAQNLYQRIIKTALKQVDTFLLKLESNNYTPQSQNHILANSWRKRGYPDGQIDFRMPARGIYNLVRALSHPYIGAHLNLLGKEVKIWSVKELPDSQLNIEPGKIFFKDDNIIRVKCGVDSIEIPLDTFEDIPKVGSYL